MVSPLHFLKQKAYHPRSQCREENGWISAEKLTYITGTTNFWGDIGGVAFPHPSILKSITLPI